MKRPYSYVLPLLLSLPVQAQDPEVRLAFELPSTADVFFGSVTDVDVFPDGRIAVNDGLSHQVHIFFATGEYSGSVGREGQGPGEIGGAQDIAITTGGHLLVLDFSNMRISEWNSELEFGGSTRISGGHPIGMAPWGDSILLKLHDFTSRRNILAVAEGNTESSELYLRSLLEWAEGSEEAVSCMFCFFHADGDRVLLPLGDTVYTVNEIDRTGGVNSSYTRSGVPAARRSEAELQRLRERMGAFANAEGGSSTGPGLYQHRFRRNSIATDAESRVWLMPSHNPETDAAAADVFDSTGYLASVDIPVTSDGIWIVGSRLYVSYQSDIGEPAIAVYEIVS